MEALEKKFDRPGGAKYKFYSDEKKISIYFIFFANDIYKLSERFILDFFKSLCFLV
jgi:hypothetical protein